MRLAILLALISAATPAFADSLVGTDVVTVFYGTETVLDTSGNFLSASNLVTASTDLTDFSTGAPTPAALLALYPTLATQFAADPQTAIANIPSWLLTGLSSLSDANGYGFDNTAGASPDPADVAFNSLLNSAPGPFVVLSDTGYQPPPPSAAECAYLISLNIPVPGPTCGFAFTYQIGPVTVGSDDYTKIVNFQVFERDVTVQQVTPEPRGWLLATIGLAFVTAGAKWVGRRGGKRVRRSRLS